MLLLILHNRYYAHGMIIIMLATRILALLLPCAAALSFAADISTTYSDYYPIGDDGLINIRSHCTALPLADVWFYHPHANEVTAYQATLAELAAQGRGCLLALEHTDGRYIHFNSQGTPTRFDPNRIYTARGREATLTQGGNLSISAVQATYAFAEHLLTRYLNHADFIVAVHNNTNGATDIHSYRHGMLGNDIAQVFASPNRDPDDYIFTTNAQTFAFFQARGFNVVLQDNLHVRDDGSLSVYAARHQIGYINIEAEHGHEAEQREMLQAAFEYIYSGQWR